MIELIDVSGLQDPANINWKLVKESGVRGVWLQASRYKGTVEQSFLAGMNAAKAAGLACGAYHFAYMGGDPREQARFAFSASKGLGQAAGDLPPMMDWEYAKNDDKGLPLVKRVTVQWAEEYMDEAKTLWYPDSDRLPLLYTFPYFADERQPYLGESGLGRWPLVLAAYGNNMTPYVGTPKPMKPWSKVTVHQYIGNGGHVPGIKSDCDRDRMDCTEDEFQAFLGNTVETFDHQDSTFTEEVSGDKVSG